MALHGIDIQRDGLVEGGQGNVSVIAKIWYNNVGLPSVSCHIVNSSPTNKVVKSHLMLLSLLLRNFPRILMARTRRALSEGVSMIVRTVSYKMELPTFLDDSVLVATYENRYQPEFLFSFAMIINRIRYS